MFRRSATAIGVAVVMAVASPARASAVLDFGTGLAGQGGTITLKNGIVTGKNIFIDAFTVAGSPGHNNVYNIDGGGRGHSGPAALLNFTTGPNGGTMSIVGRIPGLGLTSNIPLITSGAFSAWTYTPGTNSFSGQGVDVINPLLLAKLGMPANTPFEFFGFASFFGKNHTVISSDFRTNPVVPEPTTLLLVASGIVAVARRRRVMA